MVTVIRSTATAFKVGKYVLDIFNSASHKICQQYE